MNKKRKEIELRTIQRKTLAQQVVDRIIDLLQEGQFKPGDKLPPEMELMEKLYVSRPVLREALSSLESLGIIHRRARDGTYFSNKIGSRPFSNMLALSSSDLPSIIEARISIELGLVTLAAEKISQEQLNQLRLTLQEIEESEGNYSESDKEFHRIIAHSASNPIMEGMIDPLLNMFDRILSQIPMERREKEVTLEHHQVIFQALERHDPVEAFTQMYRHLSYVRGKLFKDPNIKG